jgi:hypothetical protein
MEVHSYARDNLKEKRRTKRGKVVGSKGTNVMLVAGITCRLPV